MIFLFKKKPVVLYCVTARPELLEYAPVCRVSKTLPKWWKDLSPVVREPGQIHEVSTMKHCVGFTNLYKTGAVIPMWADLALEIGPIGTTSYKYQYSDGQSEIHTHGPHQHNAHYLPTEYQHLKLLSPWVFSCDEKIDFLMMEPSWSFIKFKTLRLLPGQIDYYNQPGTHINLMAQRTTEAQQIMIPFLEPLCHVIPLTNRPLKIILSDDKKLFDKIFIKGYTSKFVGKQKANSEARKAAKL